MTEVTWHEFTLGVYVEAETEDEAWKKLQPALEALNAVDPEGDATAEHVGFMVLEK
jgi:hypothetical protein